MPSQLLIFTAVPQAFRAKPGVLPVSVIVSPRLQGANTLGAFPDWLAWTRRRLQHGLRITFECQGAMHTTDINRTILRPDLWETLFDADTLVRPYQFDDYSDSFVGSYPVRAAIGLLQATYQTAGVELALPTTDGDPREEQPRRRQLFKGLVEGYAINWDNASGGRWRAQQKAAQKNLAPAFVSTFTRPDLAAFINEDGLFRTGLLTPGSSAFSNLQRDTIERFGVVNHQPQGVPVSRASLDESIVLDFHQALSSLNTYPAIQRMLGLAFDVELPIALLPPAPFGAGVLRITDVDGDWNADTPTTVPVTSTAYFHSSSGAAHVFGPAPRYMVDNSQPLQVLGLLALDRSRYAIAQVDVDGGLHKMTILADSFSQSSGQAPAQHPEVFDTTTVLPSLRSGGMSLIADARALALLEGFHESRKFNAALEANQPQQRPFCAEDLVRGFRLDVWDSVTRAWHSLHRRDATYSFAQDEPIEVRVEDEEGFFQVAATQAAPDGNGARAADDLYLHEAIVRWDGGSLSADSPGKHLTRAGDPAKAVPDPTEPDPENEAVTPFKMTTKFTIVPRSLPRLRFGAAYRFRLRVVDLAGNGLGVDDDAASQLSPVQGLPTGDRAIPYLRFEPIVSPFIVLRDARGVTGEGSAIDRLVIRTFNSDPSLDGVAAELTAADRHIAPPRSSVEMAERLGLFDDAGGRLIASAAMWQLIKDRDEGHFAEAELDTIVIDGKKQKAPLEPGARIDALPYLPDALARGAALRDLPGTPPGSVGRVEPGAGAAIAVDYTTLDDPNPRPGSATIVGFGGCDDWQEVLPFRITLDEGELPPRWDPANRVLTVFLPKGRTHVVPVSSCADPDDLKLMGVWQWLREHIEFVTSHQPDSEFHRQTATKDRIAHVLQRAREGGHPLLTPPHLLTLVHAVQQPLGRPAFSRLAAQFNPRGADALQTQPESAPTGATELDVLTSWRRLGSTDAYLVGALCVDGASTAKVDIHAEWTDPVDDPVNDPDANTTEQSFRSHVEELPLPDLKERYLIAAGVDSRRVGFFDADHNLMCFAPEGSRLGNLESGALIGVDAAPRHRVGDAKHHLVKYRAVATSRYRDYFPAPADGAPPLDFTRTSAEVEVHVPASARPVAPQVRYVVPTFGWQRETATNQKRSLRMGGGLRVYLDRPWHSSGADERLGVVLSPGGAIDREEWKPFITQWGQDPIWQSAPLSDFPQLQNFTDSVESERGVPLDALLPHTGSARTADVAGHVVEFDRERKLWYCDLTVATESATYAPFVRLALARYQPYALVEAKVSRVVLADFAQLTPERAATVTADPYNPGQLRVAVSGPAPHTSVVARSAMYQTGNERRTAISISVQRHDASIESDLAWIETSEFTIVADPPGGNKDADFILWSGVVRFTGAADTLKSDRYRLLIRENEIMAADGADRPGRQRRLIYAETVLLDDALLNPPSIQANRTMID